LFNKEIRAEISKGRRIIRKTESDHETDHEAQVQVDQEEIMNKIIGLMKAWAISTQYNSARIEIAELKKEVEQMKKEFREKK
jgi:hypothetical protein